MDKQTYKYIKEKSIVYGIEDQYSLSKDEYYMLYSFFVTYSMCPNQSGKSKDFVDYGWDDNVLVRNINGKQQSTDLYLALKNVLDLDKNKNFVFTDKNELKEKFISLDLGDGILHNFDTERAVIGKTNAANKYLKLFYRIRDGFAHGNFKLVFSSNNEKTVVIQDNSNANVTGRIVIKLSTLLGFVNAVDKNNMLSDNSEINIKDNTKVA